MVIISSKKYKELMDRITSIENRNIGFEMKLNELREAKLNEQKAITNEKIVDEWLNGPENGKR